MLENDTEKAGVNNKYLVGQPKNFPLYLEGKLSTGHPILCTGSNWKTPVFSQA
jgi:hypothetical protein